MTTLQSSLVAWRSERKLSQAQAARLTGFSLNTWKNWEYGRRNPGNYKTQAILRTLAECQPARWRAEAQAICGCALEDAPQGTLQQKLLWVRANCMGRGTDGEIDAQRLDALIQAMVEKQNNQP